MTGHLYVVELLGRGVKVGKSRQPYSRIASHRSNAARYGDGVGRTWISPRTSEMDALERVLLARMCETSSSLTNSEFFTSDFDAAVALAESLHYPKPAAREPKVDAPEPVAPLADVADLDDEGIDMVATLRLREEQLTKYRKLAGITTNDELARRMGIDPGNLSRVLRGHQSPGPKFIASLVAAFPGMDLDDLFEVVAEAEAVA